MILNRHSECVTEKIMKFAWMVMIILFLGCETEKAEMNKANTRAGLIFTALNSGASAVNQNSGGTVSVVLSKSALSFDEDRRQDLNMNTVQPLELQVSSATSALIATDGSEFILTVYSPAGVKLTSYQMAIQRSDYLSGKGTFFSFSETGTYRIEVENNIKSGSFYLSVRTKPVSSAAKNYTGVYNTKKVCIETLGQPTSGFTESAGPCPSAGRIAQTSAYLRCSSFIGTKSCEGANDTRGSFSPWAYHSRSYYSADHTLDSLTSLCSGGYLDVCIRHF